MSTGTIASQVVVEGSFWDIVNQTEAGSAQALRWKSATEVELPPLLLRKPKICTSLHVHVHRGQITAVFTAEASTNEFVTVSRQPEEVDFLHAQQQQ